MKALKALKRFFILFYLGILGWLHDVKQQAKYFKTNHVAASGGGYLGAVIMLVAVMMATIIGAIVFFAFADNIQGTSASANATKAKVVTYAIIVFAMLAIVPMIMVGGLMLRSLGFMGGGAGGV